MIPSAIAEVLDFEMQGIDDVLTQVQKYIGKKKILLILDNFEHLMDGATLPSTLLSSCPNLKIIVTTREVLKLEEEWVKNLEGLHYPSNTNLSLEEAQGYEAVQLFIQRAKRVMLEFSANDETIATIIEICQLVEGAPLALELAAVWVRVMTLEDIVKEIKENLNFLESQSRNGSERHRSIRAVFEHSWKLLSSKEQEVFRKLSVFVGGFRRGAAAEVAGATLPILVSLVDKSLLKVFENGRYDRHPLLYQYSQRKLNEALQEKPDMETKHGEYFFDFLEKWCHALWGSQGDEALRKIDEELENIRNAWMWGLEVSDFKIFEKANDFIIYFHRRARFQEGEEFFAKAQQKLEKTGFEQADVLGIMLVNRAWLLYQLGENEVSKKLCHQSLKLNLTLNKKTRVTRMKALNTLVLISNNGGYFRQSKVYAQEALTLAHDDQDISRIALYSNNLAMIEESLGNYQEAELNFLKAQEVFLQQGNHYELTKLLENLGQLRLLLGDSAAAIELFKKGIVLADKYDFRELLAQLYCSLGSAHYQLGNYLTAKDYTKSALRFLHKAGNPSIEPIILSSLGRIETALNSYTKAQDYLLKGLKLFWINHEVSETINCLVYFSEFLIKRGNLTQACLLCLLALDENNTKQATKELAQSILDGMQHHLSTEQFKRVYEEGRGIRLDDVMNTAFLSELTYA